jgi:hypothetical protein
VFATSFLWSYLYFSQFMLIWYSNIPEEVTYFQQRIDHHPMLLWGTFFINFAIPMVMLMSRDAKRNPRFLIGVGSVIFDRTLVGCEHDGDARCTWATSSTGVGLLGSAGMFLAFLGVFIHHRPHIPSPRHRSLVVNHPYLDESVHHQI